MTDPRPGDPRWRAPARGFVVAGGLSARMGRDKALLPYGASTLVEHAITNARRVTPDVQILCGAHRRYEDMGIPVVEDAVCGAGPIGGLYAALLSASADGRPRIFWVAVDLPLVKPDVLSGLVSGLDRADVVMARTSRGPEPLCAAFQTEPTLAAVRRALIEGRLKLTQALESLRLQYLDADLEDFANLNTPGDYEGLGSR